MGKLTGMLCILLGCAGLLVSWYDRQRRRQRLQGAFVQLLTSWEYCLSRERLRLSDFLAQYAAQEPQMEAFLSALSDAVAGRLCPTGQELWRQVLLGQQRSMELDGVMLELLIPAGGAFFGRNSRECIQCARACRSRLEEELSRERTEFARKQKVYLPVGMLGGVLLVLFLL